MSSVTDITHQKIWQLSGPMILANISTPLLGMVDTAVVGHLASADYLGAVALGAMIFTFLFWSFGFLRMVTTGLTSQAQGEHQQLRQTQVLGQSILLASLIAVTILLLQAPIAKFAFAIIDSSQTIEQLAASYFSIRIWATPATLINYALLGWLIGMGRAKAALIIVLVVNISNIILDLLLVNQFGLNADGVALASVIAEYLGLLVAMLMVSQSELSSGVLFNYRLYHALLDWRSLGVHRDFMIRTLCLIFAFGFFTTLSAKNSDTILAANSVLLNFITFAAFVLDGFANATEVYAGRAVGLKNRVLLSKSLLMTGAWSVLAAVVFSLSYALFAEQIIALMTDIPAVIATAQQYQWWVIAAPLVAVWSYVLDGLFVGATRGKEMRNTMLFATFLVYLPSWWLFNDLGNHGLWLSLLLFLAARGISQALLLRPIFASVSK